MKRFIVLVLTLLLVAVGVTSAQSENTIAEIVAEDTDFSILLELLDATDLVETLGDDSLAFTVFAPTDGAFQELLVDLDMSLDDLLNDTNLVEQTLLYHVVDNVFEANDLEDGQTLESLNGEIISLTVEDESVMLNDSTEVIQADIEASNGVVHVIDAVLTLPDTASSTSIISNISTAPCTVSTDESGTARVRVGPGNNRTSVTFLDANTDFQVQGQNEDDDGTVWYQLDKEEAAPGRAINEAWVSAEDVEATGDCDNVGETSAPPVIPIVNQPPANTNADSNDDSNGGGETTSEAADTTNTGARPASGSYTIALAEFTNASCGNGQNVPIPSRDFWLNTVFNTFVSSNSSTLQLFNGSVLSFANGVYNGQILLDGEYYTTTVYPQNTSFFTGTVIVSFVSGGINCSGTVNFSASRQ